MKKLQVILAALILALPFGAGSSLAAGSATVDVQAVVQGTCSFDAASYAMDFGVIDPGTASGDQTATATLGVNCSNGTPWTLDNISGAQTMTSASGNLAYAIDAYTTTGTGTGAVQNVTITGRIAQADYSAAAADTYTDSITINVNP